MRIGAPDTAAGRPVGAACQSHKCAARVREARACRRAAVLAPYSSSSFSTAINASVGSYTVPSVRIFFLPAP